jgi:hypothetical protein
MTEPIELSIFVEPNGVKFELNGHPTTIKKIEYIIPAIKLKVVNKTGREWVEKNE